MKAGVIFLSRAVNTRGRILGVKGLPKALQKAVELLYLLIEIAPVVADLTDGNTRAVGQPVKPKAWESQ
jgi:hypothetical protein